MQREIAALVVILLGACGLSDIDDVSLFSEQDDPCANGQTTKDGDFQRSWIVSGTILSTVCSVDTSAQISKQIVDGAFRVGQKICHSDYLETWPSNSVCIFYSRSEKNDFALNRFLAESESRSLTKYVTTQTGEAKFDPYLHMFSIEVNVSDAYRILEQPPSCELNGSIKIEYFPSGTTFEVTAGSYPFICTDNIVFSGYPKYVTTD